MTEASLSLYNFLDGRVQFSSVNIQVPKGWTASDCLKALDSNRPVRAKVRGRGTKISFYKNFPLGSICIIPLFHFFIPRKHSGSVVSIHPVGCCG